MKFFGGLVREIPYFQMGDYIGKLNNIKMNLEMLARQVYESYIDENFIGFVYNPNMYKKMQQIKEVTEDKDTERAAKLEVL